MQILHNVLDPTDAPVNDGVMIALLPITSDWCKIDLPHMTLVSAGVTSDMKPTDFNEMAKDAASIAMLSGSIQLRVQGVEIFGDTDKVNVLKLQPSSELWAMRRAVESWNVSEFPFSPHCTVGPVGAPVEFVPPALAFDRIMALFGQESLTFWLKGCGRSSGVY
jgi:2'-5' RNA ligase